MSDEALRTLRREAEASRDGAAWLRVATLLAREGRFDEAGVAVLSAEECGSDGGEVLESFAPASFAMRALDSGPARPGAKPRIAWSKDGAELFVAEHGPDGTAGIIAWRVARDTPPRSRARAVAHNLPAPHVLGIVVDGTSTLLGYREQGGPTIAFVERGFLQPPLVTDHAVFNAALALGHVFTNDGETVRASLPGSQDVEWKTSGARIALDRTGTVACFAKGKIELRDPFAKKPRRTFALKEITGRIYVARRRAVVQNGSTLVLFAGDEALERRSRAADDVAVSPSGRHVAAFWFGPGLVIIDDLRTGAEHNFSIGARGGVAAQWSPSGRTLAVAKTTGELILLEGS